MFLPGLMEPVCPNGGAQERELFSAPSLKQLQRAGLAGAWGLQLVRKRTSWMRSPGLAFSPPLVFPKKTRRIWFKVNLPFTSSSSSIPVSPTSPFYLCCNNRILLQALHADSQRYFTSMISPDLLNNPTAENHFCFTDKNQRLRGYHLPNFIQREPMTFPQTCPSSSFLHTQTRFTKDSCQKPGSNFVTTLPPAFISSITKSCHLCHLNTPPSRPPVTLT